MTIEEIETIAKEIFGKAGIAKFFAIYCPSIHEEEVEKRRKTGHNMAYKFRRGERDISVIELEKLMQLKGDNDKRNLLK